MAMPSASSSSSFALDATWHRFCSSCSAFIHDEGRACTISNRTLQARKHPMLGRLARNATFVRVTVVVAWITSMVAMLSMVALIMSMIS